MGTRLCKTCRAVRTGNRVCDTCAAAKTCEICGILHGLGARAKYCQECAHKAYYTVRNAKLDRRVHTPKMQWDADSYMGLHPDSHDWARLAAYIDGEGHIGLSPRRTNTGNSMTYCGKAVVTNTDIRLALWCQKTFGLNIVQGKPQRGVWKACYYAQTSGFKAAWLLRNCLPWFVLKKEQAEVVIEHQRSTKPDSWKRGGKTPQDILEYRSKLKQRLTELNKRGPRENISDLKEKGA